jgi:serine/threonine protein kinase
MPARVHLEVVAGPIQGRRFDFEAHDTFVFGRAPDCHAELSEQDGTASRHHFLLEVNPPAARLRDLGSLNGTWVNGTRHGGRGKLTLEEAGRKRWPEVDLHDGDQVRVGTTVFAVRIEGEAVGSYAAAAVSGSAAEPPPRQVAGYEVGRLLGRGGMGAVYEARRPPDGPTVALKLLRPEVVMDQHARDVFLREIEITARLRHPNIVTLLEHGSEGDFFFFAMEYCAGGSLAALLLQRPEPLPPAAALRVALLALDGLAAAHGQGYVHRDVKPENILLAEGLEGAVKVTDFGLAKSFQQAGLSGMTATGAVGGTLHFMPREQLTGFRLLRPAGDVWSMGATLYHMLTLSYPRDFVPELDPLQVILAGSLVPLRERDPSLPASLAAVVDRAVADDLAVRYPSAAEFRDALRDAL